MGAILQSVGAVCCAGGGIVAEGRLLDLIRRLYCFGISLLKMDVRQESSRHTDTLDSITRLAACTPACTLCTPIFLFFFTLDGYGLG